MWYDMNPYDWLNKFCSFYMAGIIGIDNMCGLALKVSHRNQPNKTTLAQYKLLVSL